MKNRPAGQGYLVAAGTTLERLHFVIPDDAVFRRIVFRAGKTLRPSAFFLPPPRIASPCLLIQELTQAQAGLKLNLIHLGHDYFSRSYSSNPHARWQ